MSGALRNRGLRLIFDRFGIPADSVRLAGGVCHQTLGIACAHRRRTGAGPLQVTGIRGGGRRGRANQSKDHRRTERVVRSIMRKTAVPYQNSMFSGPFLAVFGPPRAPGRPETDSPIYPYQIGRILSQIRALGTRFVAIFRFGKGHPYQNKFCEKATPYQKQFCGKNAPIPKTLFGYGMARWVLMPGAENKFKNSLGQLSHKNRPGNSRTRNRLEKSPGRKN